MFFKRSLQRYGRTPESETPYQRAGQLWDDRIGSARVQARNWRLMSLGSLALSTSLAAGLIWISMQSRVTPYVVAVDRLGQPQALSEAQTNYQPTDPQVAWHIAHFIGNIRSVGLDAVVTRERWLEAYDFATPRGAQFIGDYARSTDPFGDIGNKTVSVQVTSVVRASDRSFQVKWTETAFERGNQTGTSRWTAILTVVTKTPRTAETLRKNPLGIYVDAIDWSREFETPQSPASPPPAPTPPPVAAESAQPATPLANPTIPPSQENAR